MSCRNSITNISERLKNLFSLPKPKLPSIPPVLLMVGSKIRPGLSSKTIASNIIRRQSEIGAHIGPMADGSENVMEKMYVIIVEEIINAIVNQAKVDIVLDPGAINIIANGANAGGPVVVQGQNILPVSGDGTIR